MSLGNQTVAGEGGEVRGINGGKCREQPNREGSCCPNVNSKVLKGTSYIKTTQSQSPVSQQDKGIRMGETDRMLSEDVENIDNITFSPKAQSTWKKNCSPLESLPSPRIRYSLQPQPQPLNQKTPQSPNGWFGSQEGVFHYIHEIKDRKDNFDGLGGAVDLLETVFLRESFRMIKKTRGIGSLVLCLVESEEEDNKEEDNQEEDNKQEDNKEDSTEENSTEDPIRYYPVELNEHLVQSHYQIESIDNNLAFPRLPELCPLSPNTFALRHNQHLTQKETKNTSGAPRKVVKSSCDPKQTNLPIKQCSPVHQPNRCAMQTLRSSGLTKLTVVRNPSGNAVSKPSRNHPPLTNRMNSNLGQY